MSRKLIHRLNKLKERKPGFRKIPFFSPDRFKSVVDLKADFFHGKFPLVKNDAFNEVESRLFFYKYVIRVLWQQSKYITGHKADLSVGEGIIKFFFR